MERKRIKLDEIAPSFGDVAQSGHFHNSDLINKVKKDGWQEIPPIPVVEIPEHLRHLVNGKKYHYTDGNHRYDAAFINGEEDIDSIIYGEKDDLEEVSKQTGGGYLIKSLATEKFFYDCFVN